MNSSASPAPLATRLGHLVVDRSAEFGTPLAAGAPTACVTPGIGVHNILYRDSLGRLHELWRDAQGTTGTTNLTTTAQAPTAIGNPFAYVDTARNTTILLFRGSDGTVRSIYFSNAPGAGNDNLSGTAGAPAAAGNPVGFYYAARDLHHMIYRTGDGHLHVLFCVGVTPIAYGGNLTATIGAPRAAGDPAAFVNGTGVNIVIYRSTTQRIFSLYWSDGPSAFEELSGVAGVAPAAGDPCAYYTRHDDTHQVVFRGTDSHLWEIYWRGADAVRGWDLTAISGGPAAGPHDPVAFYSAGTNTKHAVYRSADGRLHDIWWTPGGGVPTHVDLTAASAAPLAADRPAAFTRDGPNMHHLAYRGVDNHIYEIRWPIAVSVPPPIVSISPGPQVTADDIAQFDARWMSAEDREQRRAEYTWALKNRRAWIAWGVFDDAAAMVRMCELTGSTRYLEHLRDVNDIALQFRDDRHPGDDYPNRDNPISINGRPPFVDEIRGKVMAAWGSSLIYTDYVINGGLNPIDAVTSGIYVYGMAAFARLVADRPEWHATYGATAVRFANATLDTFWAFLPDWQTQPVGTAVEGTIYRPHRVPTATQCEAAQTRAKDHVQRFDAASVGDLFPRIDKSRSTCDELGGYAGKPLAHNESGALVMSFIELWRALDSDLYRTSPDQAANADLARGLIPLVATRHMRYFANRLTRIPASERYTWHYNDDVPSPHVEDTSHGNLDLFYVDVLRRNVRRLNAVVAPAGEPIPLNEAMLRRFANTFLQQIARPAEISNGGDVRGNVNGEPTKEIDGKRDSNNSILNGWVTLAVADASVYVVGRDVLLRVGTRRLQTGTFQNYLAPGNHAALLAHKR